MSCVKWSEEEKAYLKEIVSGKSWKEIADLLNDKFGNSRTVGAVAGAISRFGLKTGKSGCFEKGSIPYNKGTKGLNKPNKTSFKKGQPPRNFREIGSERITVDGYVEIKVANPSKWVKKHKYIWEVANGSVPANHVVIFADGDKTNFALENLVLASRKQMALMNKRKLIHDQADLTKTNLNIVNVELKVNEIERGLNH